MFAAISLTCKLDLAHHANIILPRYHPCVIQLIIIQIIIIIIIIVVVHRQSSVVADRYHNRQ
eukprot:4146009-Amphidinium_carterae.1